MRRWIVNTVFTVIYALIVIFGVGPVLFADGSWTERVWTAVVVILIAFVAVFAHFALLRPRYRI